jgi:hypothetical protein
MRGLVVPVRSGKYSADSSGTALYRADLNLFRSIQLLDLCFLSGLENIPRILRAAHSIAFLRVASLSGVP